MLNRLVARVRDVARSSRFARNTLMMTFASLAGHGLFLAASPILLRIYSPEDFALFGLFTTLHALLLMAVTGRIEWSVPNATHSRQETALITGALVVLSMSTVLLFAVALALPSDLVAQAAEQPPSRVVLLLLPLSILLGGLQAVLQSWYIARGDLKHVSVSRAALSVIFCTVAIAVGVFAATPEVLIASFALSHLGAALILFHGTGPLVGQIRALRRRLFMAVLDRFRPDILASAASSVVHGISFYMTFILIWLVFDDVVTGWYAFVFRIATAPLGLLTAAVAKGFWAEAADLAKTNAPALRRLYLKTCRVLCIPAALFAAFTLCGPLFFGFVFGAEWAGAGAILQAMTPMLAAMTVLSSTNHFIVYRKQHWQLGCDLVTITLICIAFYVMTLIEASPSATLWASSCAFLVSYLLRFALLLRANRQRALQQGHG